MQAATQGTSAIQYWSAILFQFLIVLGLLAALGYMMFALFFCELGHAVEGFEGEQLPYDPYLSNLLLQLYLDIQHASGSAAAKESAEKRTLPVVLDSVHYDQFKKLALHLMSAKPSLEEFDRELAPRMQILLAELMRPLFARDQLKHEFLLERFLQSRREAILRAEYAEESIDATQPQAPRGAAGFPIKIA